MLQIEILNLISQTTTTLNIEYSDLSNLQIKQFVSHALNYPIDHLIVEFQNTLIQNRLSDLDIQDGSTINVTIDYPYNIHKQENCGKMLLIVYVAFMCVFLINKIEF